MLEIKDLHVAYGEIEVLHGVSLHVEEGEIVTLIGANGAGKTTLLKTISGINRATKGDVRFNGASLAKAQAHKIVSGGITQVPEGREILTRMTVHENLQMGAYVRSDKEINSDIDRMYEKFPALEERRNLVGGVLSGGQQQMLAIARALMARPKLLLLDEPSLGLAPLVVVDIFRSIKDLRQEGLTILLVEQNARQALQLADRGYALERGLIVKEGSGDTLLNDPDIQAAYLGREANKKKAVNA